MEQVSWDSGCRGGSGDLPDSSGRQSQQEARKPLTSHAKLRTLPALPWQFAHFVHPMSGLDDTDRELISLLRDNARLPVATLAKKLRVARGTVQNRLARLEREGVIVGYTVRLKPHAEGHRIRALMTVAVEGNRADDVLRALRGDPAVVSLHTTNGRWDIVAELRADSLEAFDRVLSGIRLIDGIAQTETSILLSTHKL
jgi:DNA-binding Lrp family transcriptional regulator